jgi:hypothetical protein
MFFFQPTPRSKALQATIVVPRLTCFYLSDATLNPNDVQGATHESVRSGFADFAQEGL